MSIYILLCTSFNNKSSPLIILLSDSEPRVPCRVHPAEIIRTAGCGHQLAHLALRTVEGAETGEPPRDGRHGLPHQVDDHLAVLLLGL